MDQMEQPRAESSSFLTEVDCNEVLPKDESVQANRGGAPSPNFQSDSDVGFTMEIMMLLDARKVSSLRDEFQQTDDGLSMSEFVHVMLRFLKRVKKKDEHSFLHLCSEEQLVANLCELFGQIDVNGDGTMEWEEFTSFIVETGLTLKNHEPNSIQLYHQVPWEDCSKHSICIENIYYFPSNDRLCIVEHASQVLKIYNPDCDLLHTIKRDQGAVLCAGHIDRLNQYVIASSDLQMSFYDELSFRLVKSFHTSSSQTTMAWSGETNTLFSAGISGAVYAWDVDKMEEKHHMGGIGRDGRVTTNSHEDIVLDILNLSSLETLATASMDHTIRLWDVHTGKHKKKLEGHSKGVLSLAYSQEYRFLVSAGFDYDAIVWNPYVEHLILRLHGHSSSLCGVEIIPDTPQIITADRDGFFKVWDIRNFSCMQTFSAENINEIRCFSSAGKHKRIIAGGKKLVKFDYEKLENPDLTDDNAVFMAIYNPVYTTFITAAGKDVKIWDGRTGKLMRIYRNISSTDLTALCLDFRKRKFIVGDHDGNIGIYDYLHGSLMKSFCYSQSISKCSAKSSSAKQPCKSEKKVAESFALDQRAHADEVSKLVYCDHYGTVISTSWDLSISIHDETEAERGILLRKMEGGHTSDITALAYSSRLSLIATGSSDCFVMVWDFEFGRLDGCCIGHTSGILSLTFLDPFPVLLATDGSGNLCFWAVRPSSYKEKCLLRIKNKSTSYPVSSRMSRNVSVESNGDKTTELSSSDTESLTAPAIKKSTIVEGNEGDSAPIKEPKSVSFASNREGGAFSRVERGKRKSANTYSVSPVFCTAKRLVEEKGEIKEYLLYTGDEKGRVQVWSLLELLRAFETKYGIKKLHRDVEVVNPHRNIRTNATELVKNIKEGTDYKAYQNRDQVSSFFFTPATLSATSGGTSNANNLIPILSWKAHDEVIYSIQAIDEPLSLVTSSFDRLVRVWDVNGDCIGVLRQGEMESPIRPWKFEVDVESREKQKKEMADRVMGEIKSNKNCITEENKDDIEEDMDDETEEDPYHYVTAMVREKINAGRDFERVPGSTNNNCGSKKMKSQSELSLPALATHRATSSLNLIQSSNITAAKGLRKTPKLLPKDRRTAGRGLSPRVKRQTKN